TRDVRVQGYGPSLRGVGPAPGGIRHADDLVEVVDAHRFRRAVHDVRGMKRVSGDHAGPRASGAGSSSKVVSRTISNGWSAWIVRGVGRIKTEGQTGLRASRNTTVLF